MTMAMASTELRETDPVKAAGPWVPSLSPYRVYQFCGRALQQVKADEASTEEFVGASENSLWQEGRRGTQAKFARDFGTGAGCFDDE